MANMEWIEKLKGNVKWSEQGKLSLKDSFPPGVPGPVRFFLAGIRAKDMANALEYIMEGATHYVGQGYVGIIFYGDDDDAWLSDSDSSSDRHTSSDSDTSEDEMSDKTNEEASANDSKTSSVQTCKAPLQEGEVGFCVGHNKRAKYRMLEKDFLRVMEILLKIRKDEKTHEDIPGQDKFLEYVSKELNSNEEHDVHQLSDSNSCATEAETPPEEIIAPRPTTGTGFNSQKTAETPPEEIIAPRPTTGTGYNSQKTGGGGCLIPEINWKAFFSVYSASSQKHLVEQCNKITREPWSSFNNSLYQLSLLLLDFPR